MPLRVLGEAGEFLAEAGPLVSGHAVRDAELEKRIDEILQWGDAVYRGHVDTKHEWILKTALEAVRQNAQLRVPPNTALGEFDAFGRGGIDVNKGLAFNDVTAPGLGEGYNISWNHAPLNMDLANPGAP